MLFVRPRLILVFDRLSDELFVIAPIWPSATAPDRALDAAQDRIDEALRRLAGPTPDTTHAADLPEPQLTPVMQPGRYGEMVKTAKEYISAGDIFQVVLAQRFTAPFTCRLSRFTARCAGSIPRPSSISSICPALPWWAPARKFWCVCAPGSDDPPHRGHPSARQDARGRQGQ
jgi:anthranilate/para-aminobenzoate synthase component I